MSKAKKKREKIFSLYAQNLSWIKENPKITFTPAFDYGYVCPLCLNVFFPDSLDPTAPNPLSIEHNPPRSLGGKNELLTCKECNSKAGHKLDNHLLNRLLELDFLEGNPNSKIRVRLDNSGYKVNSDFSITADGTYHINIDRKNSNPCHVDNFLNSRSYNILDFFGNDIESLSPRWRLDFSMFPYFKSNERFSEIALLKIAYLLAFEQFGYISIINPNLYKVREQILNPEKDILSKVFWIKYDFPDEALGVNIINRPEELVCLLVIFNLVTPSSKRQFAIALPGLNKSGHNIYENIENILCRDGGLTKANLEHLPARDYIKKKESAYDLMRFWNFLVPRD